MQKTTVLRITLIVSMLICAIFVVTPPQIAHGATFTVDNGGDGGDTNPGDTFCIATSGGCTLRAAIQEANALGGSDTIGFTSSSLVVSPTSALPTITGPVVLIGPNILPGTAIDGTSAGNVNGVVFGGGASGSTVQGINVRNFQQNGMVIQANSVTVVNSFFGTNNQGSAAAANANGLYITGSSNIIGGANSGQRNTFSGNSGSGIVIDGGAGATGNQIRANFIGLNFSGNSGVPNSAYGIYILNASGNTVGGSTVLGNYVSANTGSGILISGGGSNIVNGNFIGITPQPAAAGNGGNGIEIVNSTSNQIGQGEGFGNFISYNVANGMALNGAHSNIIQSNTIGMNLLGNGAWPNGGSGLVIVNSNNVVVGGVVSGLDNAIGGNAAYGIYTLGGQSIQLLNNEIGTDGPSQIGIGNAGTGVRLENGTGFFMDQLTSSDNGGHGLEIIGGGGHNIQRNWFGVGNGATQALGNGGDGIYINNSDGNALGGPVGGQGNIVGGNSGSGISITDSDGTVIQHSVIGLNIARTAALPNAGHGVLIVNSNGTQVGPSYSNVNWIAGNVGGGVYVLSGTGNAVRSYVYSNGGLAIDLDGSGTAPFDGVSLNDPLDPDTGGNNLTNAPTLTVSTSNSVSGVMRGAPNTNYAISLFNNPTCDPSGFGEGQNYLNTVNVTTDSSGSASYFTGLPAPSASSSFSAVATGPAGTSEFSTCLRAYTVAVDTLSVHNRSTRNVSLINTLTDLPPAPSYVTYASGAPAGAVNGQWIMGDWNGDGQKTPGAYGTNGVFYYTNQLGAGATWSSLWLGLLNRPAVAGRFSAARTNDCVGAIDSANFPPFGTAFAMYYTCDLVHGTAPALTFQWLSVLLPDNQGFTGTHQFVAGDYDGDQVESIACRRGEYIAFSNTPPTTQNALFPLAQYVGTPSPGNSNVVAGDWNGDLIDTFGLFHENGFFYYRNDLQFNSGQYSLQRIGQPVGTPVTGHAWRAVVAGSGGPAGGEPGGEATMVAVPDSTSTAAATVKGRIESDDAVVIHSGAWANQSTSQASGGGYLYADGDEATLTLEFSGPSVEVIYLSGPQMGSFTILVDDVAVRTVIAHSEDTAYQQSTVINYLDDGPHTLQIVAANGTAAIDAFVVGE